MEKKVRIVTFASLAAIVVACGLLAIPQFIIPVYPTPTFYSISGYQFFFHAVETVYEKNSHMSGVSGLGIASIVLMALALLSFLGAVPKKLAPAKSALLMLGGLLNVAASVLFYAMEASKKHVYGSFYSFVTVGWVTYVIATLFVLTGLASIYFAFRMMQGEKKEIASKKSYSYLKK